MGLLTLGGLVFFVPGAVMLQWRIAALRRGYLVVGEIIRWDELKVSQSNSSNSRLRNRTVYTPTVRYTTREGVTHEALMDHNYHLEFCQQYPVGAPHALRYDPVRPDCAYDPSWTAMFVVPIMLLLGGAVMLLLALAMFAGTA
ncbi:MAG: DUF3592 domain-containing protein [Phyllobacteriaceae bacterium]|nr:DUF3592 domain-containing protein [Phyllobacteriaceae bacterium]